MGLRCSLHLGRKMSCPQSVSRSRTQRRSPDCFSPILLCVFGWCLSCCFPTICSGACLTSTEESVTATSPLACDDAPFLLSCSLLQEALRDIDAGQLAADLLEEIGFLPVVFYDGTSPFDHQDLFFHPLLLGAICSAGELLFTCDASLQAVSWLRFETHVAKRVSEVGAFCFVPWQKRSGRCCFFFLRRLQ